MDEIEKKNLQRLKELRPIDDEFMRCLFRENIPLAQLVLRIIMGKDDLEIIGCHTQEDMKRLVGARSIPKHIPYLLRRKISLERENRYTELRG